MLYTSGLQMIREPVLLWWWFFVVVFVVVVKLSTVRVGWFVMVMGDICAVILTLHR